MRSGSETPLWVWFQAVEYLAEWALSPTNAAFLRVQTGVFDPTQIGESPLRAPLPHRLSL